MPKTIDYNKNINVRISEEQYDEWNEFAKAKRFASISQLVRFAVDFQINQNIKEKLEGLKDQQLELLKNIQKADPKKSIDQQGKIVLELIEEVKKLSRGS